MTLYFISSPSTAFFFSCSKLSKSSKPLVVRIPLPTRKFQLERLLSGSETEDLKPRRHCVLLVAEEEENREIKKRMVVVVVVGLIMVDESERRN